MFGSRFLNPHDLGQLLIMPLAIGTIQKEVCHLTNLDLITSERDGNRVYYAANSNHLLFPDLCSLGEKTSGAAEKIKEALASLKGIESAFIFGSFAKGKEKSHSDIDLMIIGDIGLRTLAPRLKELTERLEREINPHVYTIKKLAREARKKRSFPSQRHGQ